MNTTPHPAPAQAPRPALGFIELPVTGGWHDSSIDLMLGLEVRDLGPVEWLDEWDGAFLPN